MKMDDSAENLDKWRNFFRTPNHDIFDIIQQAIIIAATDFPNELKTKREGIIELIYTYKNKSPLCVTCEITGSNGTPKESNVTGPPKELVLVNVDSNVDDAEPEGLCTEDDDEIVDEFATMFDDYEVFQIKEILDKHEEQSNTVIFDSLRKLQEMNLSLKTLEATSIGISVNALKKHGSNKEVKTLAATLVKNWKDMLNAWIISSKATDEVVIPEHVKMAKQPILEEGGLPSPPLEEGVFLDTPINMELSSVFEGLDDDGNIISTTNTSRTRGPVRKMNNLDKTKTPKRQKAKTDNSGTQEKQMIYCNDETSVEKKLESSKRRLHAQYEEIEKVKRQKTTKLMEFKDLPKQINVHRGIHKRQMDRKIGRH